MKDTEPNSNNDDRSFAEFRRKIRQAEVLSAATEKLLRSLRFSGRLCVVVQNGSILKSGYEEGYFTRRLDERMLS
jgi:sulfur carrier protein ThiS